MSANENTSRISRRAGITWMLNASSSIPFLESEESEANSEPISYDAKLNIPKKDLWNRTFSTAQLQTVSALADVIRPEVETTPSASALNIADFIDEWISAPYAKQQKDRPVIIGGLKWLNKEARKRFKKAFHKLTPTQQVGICSDIHDPVKAKPIYEEATRFFRLFQKLTLGAFYTTEVGKAELGNSPLPKFEEPTAETAEATLPKRTKIKKRKPSTRDPRAKKPKSE